MRLNYGELRQVLAEVPSGPPEPPPGMRAAGVCLLLADRPDTVVIAIQKTDTEGYHWRNQIALPGGHVDALDPSARETALRELEEELGIPRADVDLLGDLGYFRTQRSNVELLVTVGHWTGRTVIRPDSREVARVLEIPLADLIAAHRSQGFAGRPAEELGGELAYLVSEARVWGVTARIFHEFLELLLNHPRCLSG